MSTNTLTDWSAGQTIVPEVPNNIHQALNGDLVGRGATGIPTAGQNLGTVALPWGTVRTNALIINGQTVDPGIAAIPQNVIISGAVRSSSNQPFFLVPNGSALSVIVDGTPTSLVYDVNGQSFTLSADLTISSLTAAPSSNNTCLVNDTDAADQADTRLWGEYGHRKTIIVDAMGSEITALVGKYAAFKVAGTTDEFFIAFVKSATELTHALRGCFLDSSGAPIKRAAYSNNDTITLLKLGWVFLEDDAVTTSVSYNPPTWSFTSPSGPATNDYWYDLNAQTWKRYDGAAFQIIDRTLLGFFCNSTTACVGSRCQDFYARYEEKNDLELELSTTEIVKSRTGQVNATVSVAGQRFYFEKSMPSWNITTDLVAAADRYAGEAASTMYYLYLKDTGAVAISDIEPYYRPDLCGWYNPYNPWRNIGLAYNNGSSNLTQAGGRDLDAGLELDLFYGDAAGAYTSNTRIFDTAIRIQGANAVATGAFDAWVIYDPGYYHIMEVFRSNTGADHGILRNNPATDVISAGLGTSNLLGLNTQATANASSPAVSIAPLYIGDVVRVHASSAVTISGGNQNYNHFWISKRARS